MFRTPFSSAPRLSESSVRLRQISDADGNLPKPKVQTTNEQKLARSVEQLTADADAQQEESKLRILEAQGLQMQLSRLQLTADRAADALSNADSQFEQFQGAIVSIRAGFLQSWGKINGYGEVQPVPSYASLIDCERAVEDYPRVRKVLALQASEAALALSDFELEHNLS